MVNTFLGQPCQQFSHGPLQLHAHSYQGDVLEIALQNLTQIPHVA